jgi:hypothetical protein
LETPSEKKKLYSKKSGKAKGIERYGIIWMKVGHRSLYLKENRSSSMKDLQIIDFYVKKRKKTVRER